MRETAGALIAGCPGLIGVVTGAPITGSYQLVAASQSARLGSF